MANEGTIDLESPDSILTQANIRTLLNKSTFLKLPPEYQYKLMGLLPQVDRMHGTKLRHSSLNNEFFAKANQEWKERLSQGDFTQENLAKTRADIEKDKQKTDPWKVQHFEPVWGIQKDFLNSVEKLEEQNTTSLVNNNKKKECSKKQKRRSTTTILKEEDEILGDEDQPLLKKVKSKVESVVEEEKVKIEPALILGDESSPVDEIDGTEGKILRPKKTREITQQARKFKRVQAEKLVKSNKSISRIFFLIFCIRIHGKYSKQICEIAFLAILIFCQF